MSEGLTLEQIEHRLDALENMIARERDPKTLAGLNRTYQMLLDRLGEATSSKSIMGCEAR